MEYLVALAWGGATGSVLGACVRVGVAGGGVRGGWGVFGVFVGGGVCNEGENWGACIGFFVEKVGGVV